MQIWESKEKRLGESMTETEKPVHRARPDLLSVDMARELERQAWERAAQMEMESEPVAAQPVFFENVANDGASRVRVCH